MALKGYPLLRQPPGCRLNIKTAFPRYGDSYVKDVKYKALVRPSYLLHGDPSTGKTYLYGDGPQVPLQYKSCRKVLQRMFVIVQIQVPWSKIVYQHGQSFTCSSLSDSRFDVESQKVTIIFMPNFPSRVHDEVAVMTIPGDNIDDKVGIVQWNCKVIWILDSIFPHQFPLLISWSHWSYIYIYIW